MEAIHWTSVGDARASKSGYQLSADRQKRTRDCDDHGDTEGSQLSVREKIRRVFKPIL